MADFRIFLSSDFCNLELSAITNNPLEFIFSANLEKFLLFLEDYM